MENKVIKIVWQLRKYKNGVTADSMTNRMLAYKINYGVPIVNIKEVAKLYEGDNALSMQLFARPEREAKLAAIYITDEDKLTEKDINNIEKQIINNELAEHIVLRIIARMPNAVKYAIKWCKQNNNEFLQKAGWMTIGRIAINTDITEQKLGVFFELIGLADFASAHVRAALIFALPKLALKSDNMKEKVKNWINKNIKSDDANIQYTANEINIFLAL